MPAALVALAAALVALPGCPGSGPSPDFSEAAPGDTAPTNATRVQLGVRPIRPTWTFLYRNLGEEHWRDDRGRICKTVKRIGRSQIEWEADRYESGTTFPPLDPDSDPAQRNPEYLVVQYEYKPKRFFLSYNGVDPATKKLLESLPQAPLDPAAPQGGHTRGSMYQGATDRDTLAVADAILRGWKLDRRE